VQCALSVTAKELSDTRLKNSVHNFANEDVTKLYLWARQTLIGTRSVREPTVIKITEITAVKLEELLLKSSIPSASHNQRVCFQKTSFNWNKSSL
jgi:hypothetical protein